LKEFLLAALVAFAGSAHAQMYKCVDEKGVTQYRDQPCAPGKGKAVNIQPIPSLSGAVPQAPGSDIGTQEADFRRRQVERAEAEAAGQVEMNKHCARLRRENALLSSGSRVSRLTPEGKRVYMDDASRESRLVELRDALRSCP
jgi:hypothetical protein